MVSSAYTWRLPTRNGKQSFPSLWLSAPPSAHSMANYTQGIYEARELAMERMQAESAVLQATNIVGVSISQDNYQWESHIIEFFTLGTAVIPLGTDHSMPTPSLTLPLNG